MNFGEALVQDFRQAQGLKEVNFPRMAFQPHLARGIPPDDNSDEFRELYSIQATIYRCVYVRGSNLARLPKKVVKVVDENTTEDVSQNPEFDVLLKTPNPFQTMYQFWESTLGYLDLQGEAPWALVKNGSKLLAIIPLRPDKIKVIPDPENLIAGYVFENQNVRFAIPADEMVFLKYFNPNSDFRGLSPLKAAMLDVELDLRAISANKSMLATGGLPSGILSLTDGTEVDEGQWDSIKRQIREQYGGSTNRGKIMALDFGVKWEQLQLDLQEMEYMKGRAFTQNIVRMVYGVPPIMIGDFEQATIKASSFTQERTFWSETMTPLTRMLSEVITKEVLPLLSPDPALKFIYDLSEVPALQADRAVQSKIVKDGIGTAQITPNEGRVQIFNLDPVLDPAMDQHYIAGNLIPISSFGEEPQEESGAIETVKMLDGVVKMLESKTPFERVNQEMETIQKGLDARKADEKLFKVWKGLERIRERSITAFDRLMNKLFDEQRRAVLNNLRKQAAFWKQVTVNTVFDYDEWVMRFQEEGEPLIARALKEAAEDLADNVGGTYDISGDPRAATFVNFESRQYAVSVNSTTQGKIDTILRGAVSGGLNIAETATLINKYYEANAPFRAERIARTEMVKSTNAGRTFSMQQNGFESHMWVTQRDARVRDEHIPLDGEVVRIGRSFSNGDSYPQSPNERCFTIPQRKKL